MLERFRAWREQRKALRADEQYRDGFEWAAGQILLDRQPLWHLSVFAGGADRPFDAGVQRAVNAIDHYRSTIGKMRSDMTHWERCGQKASHEIGRLRSLLDANGIDPATGKLRRPIQPQWLQQPANLPDEERQT